MTPLDLCTGCGGFVPCSATRCPHCDRARSGSALAKVAKSCLMIATGGAVAVTLMACYGGPPHAYEPVAEPPQPCGAGVKGEGSDPKCGHEVEQGQPLEPVNTSSPEYAQPPPGQPPGT